MKSKNINLMLVSKTILGEPQSHFSLFFWDQEFLYKSSWQSTKVNLIEVLEETSQDHQSQQLMWLKLHSPLNYLELFPLSSAVEQRRMV